LNEEKINKSKQATNFKNNAQAALKKFEELKHQYENAKNSVESVATKIKIKQQTLNILKGKVNFFCVKKLISFFFFR
jgi:hypothetical protein